jgi:hypothetical protein
MMNPIGSYAMLFISTFLTIMLSPLCCLGGQATKNVPGLPGTFEGTAKVIPGTYASSGTLTSKSEGMEKLTLEIVYLDIRDDGTQILGAKGKTYAFLPDTKVNEIAQKGEKQSISKIKTKSNGVIIPLKLLKPNDPSSLLVRIEGHLEYLKNEDSLVPLFFNPGASYQLKIKTGDYVKVKSISYYAEKDSEITLTVSKDGEILEKVLSGKIVRKVK